MEIVSQYQNELIILLVLVSVIQLFWIFILSIKIGKTRKRLNRFTRGEGNQNLGQLIEGYNQEIETMKHELTTNTEKIDIIFQQIGKLKGRVGMVRYNAFGEQGNDLSFSIAMLDEKQNGIVITSIYNREQSNTYAKPIENGQSSYRLSEEEKKAIEKAIHT
ncbi:DUF4446 family protein [Tepidibacillus fermentans]|uniref:Uncharacterized protein DUF4446 n=1 Tax=Tepidibacillus fermentans TaxID=1281767 RepID=A0A4R3KCN8_9BACI|nr:DUF4446 family protein [Tepidibacillus fermentans]TCS80810.1 uncharacterized protein DUF4446 [Tepidibacillus fermentans]